MMCPGCFALGQVMGLLMGMTPTLDQLHGAICQLMVLTFDWPDPSCLDWLACLCGLVDVLWLWGGPLLLFLPTMVERILRVCLWLVCDCSILSGDRGPL